jgi:hypothetical protein
VPVTGTLTYKGKPVANTEIHFSPVSGDRPSWGLTDNEGRFELEYEYKVKGAITGRHKVAVKARPVPTTYAEQQAAIAGKPLPVSKDMAVFFNKYGADKSKVEIDIEKSTDLKLDWD